MENGSVGPEAVLSWKLRYGEVDNGVGMRYIRYRAPGREGTASICYALVRYSCTRGCVRRRGWTVPPECQKRAGNFTGERHSSVEP